MQLTLLTGTQIAHLALPDKVSGCHWLRKKAVNNQWEDVICIEGILHKWVMESNPNVMIFDQTNNTNLREVELEPLHFYNIKLANNEQGLIYTEPVTENRKIFQKLTLPVSGKILIGRSSDCDIVFINPFVSSRHVEINIEGSKITIHDLKSANGTFVNGIRITNQELHVGDIIYILGLKIILGLGFLSYNNPDDKVSYRQDKFTIYQKQKLIPKDDSVIEAAVVEDLFFRSPRFKRDIHNEIIKIDAPPQSQANQTLPLALTLGPSLTMGMASLSMGAFTVVNAVVNDTSWLQAAPSIVMSSSMLLGTLLWPILTKQYEKKQRIKREHLRQEKYKNYLVEKRKEIEEICVLQESILKENYIDLKQCKHRIVEKNRTLWEKTLRHNDYLSIRVGIGNRNLIAQVEYPEKRFTLDDDNLQEEMYQLAKEPKLLHNVPITYSMIEDYVSGIIGEREKVMNFLSGMILQIATMHSYDEVKMVFLYDEKEENLWRFARWLPHAWNEQKTFRYMASNQEELKEISTFFDHLKSERMSEHSSDISKLLPNYLVFVGSVELASKLESLTSFITSDKYYGVSIITIDKLLHNLPKDCSVVVELEEKLGYLYDKNDISGHKIEFEPDIELNLDLELYAKKLANIHLDISSQRYQLPDMLTFLEMFQVGKMEQLNPFTRWKENDPTKTLQTPVGVDNRGDIFYLDLHEKFHGPHGLVAGMTGSGKSEFIITYILSMAVNYHPDEVSFILIDYKGGGLTGAFENDTVKLPHLAGTITNLDGALVKRSLISIQSELRRRQAEFNEARRISNEGTMDIYKYQKLYREKVVKEPIPHLFIISDEFAELKTQQPEFMEQLISAARIGRSLGVHLILATQKPAGVVDDQIWSNSRFRVCLKVQEKADSMDMIKRPDAAELSHTGRFYLQVGFNEYFDLGQSAWCGAPYQPTDRIVNKVDHSIQIIDNLGRVIRQVKPKDQHAIPESKRKQIVAITKYLSDLAKEEKIAVRPLWLEAMKPVISLHELLDGYPSAKKEKFKLKPMIGQLDDPFNQAQKALYVPFSEEGNALVYGVAGSGKTNFLTTMMYHLLIEHTVDTLNLYILDFEAETLRAFKKAPQVGDVLFNGDHERIENLWKMLSREIKRRKQLFADSGGDFYKYNEAKETKVPNILVVINNYPAYAESYPETEEILIYLAREGTKYGIYFILSVSTANGVRLRLQQNFKQIFLLQLNDKSEYSAIIGTTEGVYPSKYKGRGIIKTDKTYEFQTAYVVADTDHVFDEVEAFCQRQKEDNHSGYAKRIPILPSLVNLEFVTEQIQSIHNVPIGVDKKSLNVVTFNFSSYVNVVYSNEISKLSDFGFALTCVLKEVYKKQQEEATLIVFDAAGLCKNYVFDSTIEYYNKDLDEQIVTMFQELVKRNHTYKDSTNQELEMKRLKPMIYVIPSMKALMDQLSADGKDKLRVLLEKGEKEYRVHILILEEIQAASTYTATPWYRKHVNASKGIWLGNGFSGQYTLKVNQTTNELYQEIGEDFGYAIDKGKYTLIKTLTARTEELEEER